MMVEKNAISSSQSSSPDIIILCLNIMAGLCAAGGALGAFWIILGGSSSENSTLAGIWMSGLGVLLMGFGSGTMFWGMGWIVKQHHQAHRVQQKLLQHLTATSQTPLVINQPPLPSGISTPDTSPATNQLQTELLNRILNQLGQLSTNVLLTGEQRQEKYQQVQENIIDQLSLRSQRQ